MPELVAIHGIVFPTPIRSFLRNWRPGAIYSKRSEGRGVGTFFSRSRKDLDAFEKRLITMEAISTENAGTMTFIKEKASWGKN